MKWYVFTVLMLLFCGCEVNVQEKTPDVNVVKPPDVNVVEPPDVNVTTPKVDVEVNRK